ncbi:MAG TPA: gamma-glutamyltransferase [Gammaproteobacteria bacterium]
MIRRLRILLLVAWLPLTSAIPASTSEALFKNVTDNAIASAHPLATQAGYEILAAGGNAFDAAVAITAALAVVEPYSSGIGGGGFYLLHRTMDGFETMLDARETAPGRATSNMYLDEDGNVIPGLSRNGPLSAGIPGIPAALEHLAKRYGKLPLNKSLAPAIRYAKQGFPVTGRYRLLAGFRVDVLKQYREAARVFLDAGQIPEEGFTVVQQDLAETLTAISENGAAGFYKGPVAKKLVEGVRDAGGIWRLSDLAEYRVIERQPLYGEYGGMRIVGAPLPSSGGIVLINIFNILSQYDLDSYKAPQRIHLIVEAMRRAYRDRAEYLGDADFVDVPVERLLNPFYAAGQAASVRLDKATPSMLLPGAPVTPAGTDTTHFSIIDKQGNRVSATLSVNLPFGSGYMPPGTGVLLNNEMDDFAAKPGVPNAYGLVAGGNNPNSIEPGKRMLSSMSPTFLETDERIAVLGTPGGSRIITMVLLAALDFYQGGDAERMVMLPRFHHQFLPDRISFEPEALDQNTRLELQWRGHQLDEMNRRYGNMQVVIFNKASKKFDVASDPRGEGLAEVR